MLKRHLRELVCANSRPLEFILAIQAILYGGWLLLPIDTFNVSPTFSIMKGIAPEYVWGVVIFGVGVIQFFGLFTENILARRVLGFMDLFLWLMVDLALWLASTSSLAPIFISTSVVAAVLINISLAVGDCE